MSSLLKDFEKFISRLRVESLALATLMIVLTYESSAPLWILPATFILFDVCIIGYLVNSRVGAAAYNFIHDFTIPTVLIALGIVANSEWISILGFTWTFHVAIDRSLGFGLKHSHSFKHTHLGEIGKTEKKKRP